jgi:hypothetical protein
MKRRHTHPEETQERITLMVEITTKNDQRVEDLG